MIWLGIAIAVVAVALVILVARARHSSTQQRVADVDPLFSTGIVITGAGVVLGTTIGPVMYAVMTAGLIIMAFGAHRSQQHPHPSTAGARKELSHELQSSPVRNQHGDRFREVGSVLEWA